MAAVGTLLTRELRYSIPPICFQGLPLLESFRQGNKVDGLAALVEIEDGGEDFSMGLAIEIPFVHHLQDAVQGLIVQQNAAQDRDFRFETLGRKALCQKLHVFFTQTQ